MHRFKPGQSGNPGGRPRGRSLRSMLAEFLHAQDPTSKMTYAEKIVRKVVGQAVRGNMGAIKMAFAVDEGGENASGPAITFVIEEARTREESQR